MTAGETYAVRMGMPVAEGEALSDILLRCPADVAARVHDQLWLRTVLVEQRRRTTIPERPAFDDRADRLLALLDPQEDDLVQARSAARAEAARLREVLAAGASMVTSLLADHGEEHLKRLVSELAYSGAEDVLVEWRGRAWEALGTDAAQEGER